MTEPRNYLAEAIAIARGESGLIATEEHVKALYDVAAVIIPPDKAGQLLFAEIFARNRDNAFAAPTLEPEPDIERDRR